MSRHKSVGIVCGGCSAVRSCMHKPCVGCRRFVHFRPCTSRAWTLRLTHAQRPLLCRDAVPAWPRLNGGNSAEAALPDQPWINMSRTRVYNAMQIRTHCCGTLSRLGVLVSECCVLLLWVVRESECAHIHTHTHTPSERACGRLRTAFARDRLAGECYTCPTLHNCLVCG